MITSAQNLKLKLVRALLGRPKERRKAKAFVAEGVRLLEEALAANWSFRFVLAGETLSERGEALVAGLQARGVEVERVTDALLNSLSDTENTQGLLAVLDLPTSDWQRSTLDFVLIPDQIRDPGNLGTLLRTAAAAGAQAVFLPPETTDAFAPKVVRAGMGAHFRLPILPLPWDEIRARTSGLRLLLADMDGLSCWETDLRPPLALIVGGEAEGASPAAQALATAKVSIPMPGGMESLNAAVAGAILMFEVVRQRQMPRIANQ
ncbi:MAG: RNA methyltransferase [Anaerolineales bacterium]|nr:RNA methyltransferase [Anaerolineales bacterium]MCX7608897.1 RNA methyltransferase [Anaerolineales bacterium]